ncbi:MAG: hypothetical protein CMP20_04640 [Rickettsiales bacterium]|nr:hypothetical protein [Rickettsiales bacterium]
MNPVCHFVWQECDNETEAKLEAHNRFLCDHLSVLGSRRLLDLFLADEQEDGRFAVFAAFEDNDGRYTLEPWAIMEEETYRDLHHVLFQNLHPFVMHNHKRVGRVFNIEIRGTQVWADAVFFDTPEAEEFMNKLEE